MLGLFIHNLTNSSQIGYIFILLGNFIVELGVGGSSTLKSRFFHEVELNSLEEYE